MRLRLSGDDLPGLAALTARSTDGDFDPAVALLDGWACLSEVLGFYTTRAVHESYLRTCIEHRSAVALAALVGYAPRPGVAADAWLAFLLDDLDREATLEVPDGTRAYSVPGPGETMQPFETVEPLTGRPRWSRMHARQTIPQWLVPAAAQPGLPPGEGPQDVTTGTDPVWFAGTSTGLLAGQPLLFDFDGRTKVGRIIRSLDVLPATTAATVGPPSAARTRVMLRAADAHLDERARVTSISGATVRRLLEPAALFTAGSDALVASPKEVFGERSYAPAAALAAAYPQLVASLADAIAGTPPTGPTAAVSAFAMRVTAAVHGHNAPQIAVVNEDGVVTSHQEWPLPETPWDEIALDAVHPGIQPGSQVAVLLPWRPDPDATDEENRAARSLAESGGFDQDRVFTVTAVRTESRTAFGLPAKVSVLTLDREWFVSGGDDDFGAIRSTVVHAQSEPLELAERPIGSDVGALELVLDGFYPGLEPGRRLIVSGERSDLDGVTGVRASELVMVSGVSHGTQPDDGWSAPDGVHTRVSLAQPGLRYRYRRTSVTVHGNVAHATHGESRAEVLGSGDAARRMQQFELKQHPLTFVSATTTSGIASTLGVRVNGLRWREAPNAAAVTADERAYLVTAEGGEPTTVVTGLGARLPTGRDNVRATYRSGLGRTGNVRAGQISVLGSQPAGVTGVTNLLATTGGADPDDLDRVRELAAIGLSALDRLVSASDLEDFARRFAGIGKAQIWQLDADTLVLSIAGVHDVPIAPGSALLRNLSGAIAVAGDLEQTAVDELMTRNLPSCRIVIRTRAARLIALRARVRLHPDHAWPDVQPRLRAALGRELGFDARRLGQVLDPSAVVAVMQRVRGVVAVDLQGLGTIDTDAASETADPVASIADQALAALSEPADGRMPPVSAIPDGAIAYWSPDASGTLLLSAWEEE